MSRIVQNALTTRKVFNQCCVSHLSEGKKNFPKMKKVNSLLLSLALFRNTGILEML